MPSSKKQLLVAAIGASLVIGLAAACTSASADSSAPTDQVACDQVDSSLSDAQTQLTNAEAEAEKAKDTPDEADANNVVIAARAQVVVLNTRKTECAVQTTSVSTSPEASTSAAPTSSAAPAPACATTWKMEAPLADGNVMPQVDEILNATTDADASAAMDVWANGVRPHAATLASSAKIFLNKEVDAATLTDADGCATLTAAQLDQELRLTIHAGNPTPEEAPADGTNTGLVDGAIMASTGPGIDGDRRAVKITLQDGAVVWVMGRCGNPVFKGNVPIPTSPKAPAPVPPPAPPADVPPEGGGNGCVDNCDYTPPKECEGDTPHGDYPICKDDSSRDVQLNPNVPDQVKGPGTTPIGGDPGPASRPTDSPTGCQGTCQNSATATAAPANPAQTQPTMSSTPAQVQNPVTAVASIPADAGATGVAGSGCEMDPYGNPIGNC